jgi:hypothetical protein
MMELENRAEKNKPVRYLDLLKRWLLRIGSGGIALSVMIWANESTLRPAHIMNSVLAAIVVLFVISTEIMMVRDSKAMLNPTTLLINTVVLFFPLFNIAVYSWVLAFIIVALSIAVAWLVIRARQVIVFEKKH